MKLNLFVVFLSILLVYGCKERPIYSSQLEVKSPWTYDTPLVFDLQAKDSTTYHDLLLNLEYDRDFGYQNIYVKIVTQFPNGKYEEDILSLNIMDRAGMFLGKCNDKKCNTELLLQERFRFHEVGKHQISIYQHSRDEFLAGIKNATLKLYVSP